MSIVYVGGDCPVRVRAPAATDKIPGWLSRQIVVAICTPQQREGPVKTSLQKDNRRERIEEQAGNHF
jgi:hypothetical protein